MWEGDIQLIWKGANVEGDGSKEVKRRQEGESKWEEQKRGVL